MSYLWKICFHKEIGIHLLKLYRVLDTSYNVTKRAWEISYSLLGMSVASLKVLFWDTVFEISWIPLSIDGSFLDRWHSLASDIFLPWLGHSFFSLFHDIYRVLDVVVLLYMYLMGLVMIRCSLHFDNLWLSVNVSTAKKKWCWW